MRAYSKDNTGYLVMKSQGNGFLFLKMSGIFELSLLLFFFLIFCRNSGSCSYSKTCIEKKFTLNLNKITSL